MFPSWFARPVLMTLACGLGAVGCGGSEAGPASPADGRAGARPGAEPGSAEDAMSAEGEMGGLDKAEVQAVFERALPAVNRCVETGRKRLPFLSGDIAVYLRVNAMGKAAVANLTHSTLGDQAVESCILAVWRAQQWPRPVGGKVGETTHSMGFSPDPDEEPPLAWDAESLDRAMQAAVESDPDRPGDGGVVAAPFAELREKLDGCRADAGARRLAITLYLDEDGMAQAVGLGSPDESGRRALDCIKTVLETTSFPAPRSNFAKITMSVP